MKLTPQVVTSEPIYLYIIYTYLSIQIQIMWNGKRGLTDKSDWPKMAIFSFWIFDDFPCFRYYLQKKKKAIFFFTLWLIITWWWARTVQQCSESVTLLMANALFRDFWESKYLRINERKIRTPNSWQFFFRKTRKCFLHLNRLMIQIDSIDNQQSSKHMH